MAGPDHERTFRVEVWVEGEVLGVGEGSSRRVAETAAAAEALDRLRGTRRAAGGIASARGGHGAVAAAGERRGTP